MRTCAGLPRRAVPTVITPRRRPRLRSEIAEVSSRGISRAISPASDRVKASEGTSASGTATIRGSIQPKVLQSAVCSTSPAPAKSAQNSASQTVSGTFRIPRISRMPPAEGPDTSPVAPGSGAS